MSAPIGTLIIDDEPLARQIVRVLLERDPAVRVLGEAAGVDAQEAIRRTRPELIFLDIQMPEVSGFDVLASLDSAQVPVVVFVTAYDQYALRAFQVHAVEYLLKPFDDERFVAVLAHAKQQVRARQPAPPVPPAAMIDHLAALVAELSCRGDRHRGRFLIRTGERSVLVRVPDIDWIEAADYYAQLHVGPDSHLIRESLTELEQELDPTRFFRIHRSAIVNLDRVVEIHNHLKGDAAVVLKDGRRLVLSKKRRDEFERLLGRVR